MTNPVIFRTNQDTFRTNYKIRPATRASSRYVALDQKSQTRTKKRPKKREEKYSKKKKCHSKKFSKKGVYSKKN